MQAVQLYTRINAHSGVHAASPHRLIQMLMEGALSAMATAKGHIHRNEKEPKGISLGKVINRIEGLRVSLDLESGGAIAANLHALYEYMERRVVEANLNNDAAAIGEVESLMREIKVAWDALETPAPTEQGAAPGSGRRLDAAV